MESDVMGFRLNGFAGAAGEVSGGDSSLVLMSTDDVAKYLAMPKSWVYGNWRSQGIPFKRVGNALRCRMGDLDDWLDRQVA
ncbi:helix-turn-helix domain-containing protein [Streptomyces hygroscopicus]|uniref:helix-turn-helix domain-containing protein n=1 Tax=Streptomyces hygroscopicus TaxID=1912 RepID=UPI003262DCAB